MKLLSLPVLHFLLILQIMAESNSFLPVPKSNVVYFFAPVKIEFKASSCVNVSMFSHASSSVFACPEDVFCVKGCIISQINDSNTDDDNTDDDTMGLFPLRVASDGKFICEDEEELLHYRNVSSQDVDNLFNMFGLEKENESGEPVDDFIGFVDKLSKTELSWDACFERLDKKLCEDPVHCNRSSQIRSIQDSFVKCFIATRLLSDLWIIPFNGKENFYDNVRISIGLTESAFDASGVETTSLQGREPGVTPNQTLLVKGSFERMHSLWIDATKQHIYSKGTDNKLIAARL